MCKIIIQTTLSTLLGSATFHSVWITYEGKNGWTICSIEVWASSARCHERSAAAESYRCLSIEPEARERLSERGDVWAGEMMRVGKISLNHG